MATYLYPSPIEAFIKEESAMSRPGQYVPDPTEGVTNPIDLPKPKIKRRFHTRQKSRCPHCNRLSTRHALCVRRLHDLGDSSSAHPIEIILHYSKHYCCECNVHFTINTSHIAPPKSAYTNAVIALALRLIVEDGLPYRAASGHLWRAHRVYVPFGTIKSWVECVKKNESVYLNIPFSLFCSV